MKRTDLERHQRELKRSEKKHDLIKKKTDSKSTTSLVGEYINNLFSLFKYDSEEIYNIKTDIKILEIIENIKENLPEKQWENVLKKAVKKAKVNQKDRAVLELKELIGT